MGCGGSKPEAEDNIVPLVLRPLRPFRRRIDTISKRRNGGNLSTKLLLHDREDRQYCPTDATSCGIRKSVSSPPEGKNEGSGNGQSMPIKDATATEVHHRGASTPGNDDKIKMRTPGSDKKSMRMVVPAEEETEREVEKDNRKGQDEEEEHLGERKEDDRGVCGSDDEGEGGSLDVIGHNFAPRSPSFRVFFIPSVSNAADIDPHDAGNGEDKSGELTTEDKPSERKESSSSSDGSKGSVDKLVKKESTARRFRNVLQKGKQDGVKKFLKVRSRYHSSRFSIHGKVVA